MGYHFRKIYAEILYFIDRILYPPAKVMFVIWTICCISTVISNKISDIRQYIPVYILGYVIYCGLANLIYRAFKKKYLNYQETITIKQLTRLHKLMKDTDPVRYAQTYPNGIENSLNNHVNETMIPEYTIPKYNNYDCMSGLEFEEYCAELLTKLGYYNVETTKASGDHGIDILAEKDEVTYAIQCKCYSSNVGNAAVQQALTGKKLYRRDIAVVFTNQYFTPQAIEEATALGVKLWDKDKLNQMIEQSNSHSL